MGTEAGIDRERQGTSASAFWWRLADNAFRRFIWLLLPVVLFAGLGAWQSSKTLDLYRSGGLLSASSNPLVPEQQIGGVAQAQFWETNAEASSRTINEQLRTDSFVEIVAERAGLTDQLESGFLELTVVRNALWSSSSGSSLVNVNAVWGDAQTAHGLVDGTIGAYLEFVAESVASQSSEAVLFYRQQLAEFEIEVETASSELETFVTQVEANELAAGDEDRRSILVELQITRLTGALDAAELKVATTQEQIDLAELQVTQSRSEAGRSLTVIDAPEVPTAPQSTLVKRASIVISFTLLGFVIMLTALVISTVLDQSVASAADLRGIDGVELVATVPAMRFIRPSADEKTRRGRRRRRGRRGRRAKQRAPEIETQRETVGV